MAVAVSRAKGVLVAVEASFGVAQQEGDFWVGVEMVEGAVLGDGQNH